MSGGISFPRPATRIRGLRWRFTSGRPGAPLGYCMAAAAECGAELTPGDFVRQARQVVDLLEQVRKTGYHEDTIWAARHAVDAIRRGVVAIGA